ncbi:hypothetical protein [Chamaesiphon sp. OTE_20_metabat_361]|uniref:hypothetical protein n=1 Tax=Chamaesiphon sp. OTE_20_metabat_361 TaxID=2964689 RepID=UPI00286B09D5|nr:hypothetical protein [Chamaesiphon sp. OTE_20_metabat_361]
MSPFIAKVDRDSKVKVWKDNPDLLSELNDFLKYTLSISTYRPPWWRALLSSINIQKVSE